MEVREYRAVNQAQALPWEPHSLQGNGEVDRWTPALATARGDTISEGISTRAAGPNQPQGCGGRDQGRPPGGGDTGKGFREEC